MLPLSVSDAILVGICCLVAGILFAINAIPKADDKPTERDDDQSGA